MKIMFCLGGLEKGGAERVVCNLANYLVSNKIDVTLIVNNKEKKEYWLDSKVKVLDLDKKKENNFFKKNLKRLSLMKEYIIKDDPDLIFGFLQEPTSRLLILKKFVSKIKKIPIVVSVRIDPKVAFKTMKRKIGLMLYNNADGFVFQTSEAQSFFNKRIQNKSIVIENSINPEFFDCKYERPQMCEKRIVSVGRLTKQKNYPMLINSFKIISEKYPDYILEIYGDGELKNDLELMIDNLHLRKKVYLKGNVDDIKKHIFNADIFVISSDYEGMSNALMEAMALGIPCISTKSSGGGAETLIDNKENGILVPVGNVDILSKEIEYLINNELVKKELSKAARISMEKYYPETINKRWLDYIYEIINKQKRVK